MDVLTALADLLDPPAPPYQWVCDRDECDGQPHPGNEAKHARTKQRTPDGAWMTWLITPGRGWGKTRTGAETLADWVLTSPRTVAGRPTEWLVAGPTYGDTHTINVPALREAFDARAIEYVVNLQRNTLTLTSGQVIHLTYGDDEDLGRGLNLAGAWVDELGTWRRAATAWTEALVPALRVQLPGSRPRVIVTTTPKVTRAGAMRLLRDLQDRNDGSVHVTRGATWENAANLSAEAITELRARYPEGSRLYRQELLGEIVDEVEGALFAQADIDEHRVTDHPDLVRVVVGYDPAVTFTADSDETGIIAAGSSKDRQVYVLADASGRYTGPEQATAAAVALAAQVSADAIIYETNQGAQYVEQAIKAALRHAQANGRWTGPLPRIQGVHAKRGKALRAEPVAVRYAQGEVHHVGPLPQLEEQMTTWTPEASSSPDRLDALVYAVTHLTTRTGPTPVPVRSLS